MSRPTMTRRVILKAAAGGAVSALARAAAAQPLRKVSLTLSWVAEGASVLRRHNAKAHAFENLEREESAMLPSAEPERFRRQKHVLADRHGLAEDVVAGLPLEDRQR